MIVWKLSSKDCDGLHVGKHQPVEVGCPALIRIRGN
jgi:hypothetical protein